MPKRIFIIHRWDGVPESDWYNWLRIELEGNLGFNVEILRMPNTVHPKIDEWIWHLSEVVGIPDGNTYFVGHSIGCQAILRYLEKTDGKCGGCVFVAPWFKLSDEAMPTSVDADIARPWIYTPIDFNKVLDSTKTFIAIFSENDPYVPLENAKMFKDELGAKIIIEKDKGHFTADDKVTVVPTVLKEILKIVR